MCTTKQTMMIPYRYHKADDFSLIDLSTENEPEEPLEELIARYEALCKNHHEHRLDLQELAKPYTCVKTVNGKEITVIDYERWEKEDIETFCSYTCGEVNSSCVFEAYEYIIDLKIAFLNRKDAK